MRAVILLSVLVASAAHAADGARLAVFNELTCSTPQKKGNVVVKPKTWATGPMEVLVGASLSGMLTGQQSVESSAPVLGFTKGFGSFVSFGFKNEKGEDVAISIKMGAEGSPVDAVSLNLATGESLKLTCK